MRALEDDGNTRLFYLPFYKHIQLTENTCLIGHGLWGDGRNGNFFGSNMLLNDFNYIDELTHLSPEEQYKMLNELGDIGADCLKIQLNSIEDNYENIIVLTHVQPFAKGSWHRGNPSDANALPFYSCKAAGDVL